MKIVKPHANVRIEQEIIERLLTPSDKAINETGVRLPNALLGLWASLGYGYQKMYPLSDMKSVNDFIFWWLHYGQNEHPGFRAHINRYLVDVLHTDSRVVQGDHLKQSTSALMDLIYSNRDDLKILYPIDGEHRIASLLEWWYTFGFKEYKIPNFGLSLDLIGVLSEIDPYGDFGYGEQFTKAARYLYQYVGAWRQAYNLFDVPGAIQLMKYVVTEVICSPEELNIFFLPSAIDKLAELTSDFTDFEADGFRHYCLRLCTWGQTAPAQTKDEWWTASGRQKCAKFIDALRGQPRGVQGYLKRHNIAEAHTITKLLESARAATRPTHADNHLTAVLTPDDVPAPAEGSCEETANAALLDTWMKVLAETDAFGSFGYGEQFTGLVRYLYSHVETWRRAWDINVLPGAAELVRHVLLDLENGPDDLLLIFTRDAIERLAVLSNGFRDFYTPGFKQYCFNLSMWAKPLEDLELEAWWETFGHQRCSRFINALALLNAEGPTLTKYLRRELKKGSSINESPSVAMIGYPHGAFGIGEDARLVGKALEMAGLKSEMFMSARKIISASPEFEQYPPVSQYHGSDVTIFCMPAFDTLALLHDFGPYPFTTGYRIGLWQWELQEFPKEAFAAFSLVDEIWTISRHAADSFRKKTTKPVHVIPLPVYSELITPIQRARFGIPEDAFLFGFAFDGASFIARKNPLALIEAFQRAFPKTDESVYLMIKAMNTQNESVWKECLYRADTDARIVIIDEVLSRGEANGLLNTCDCIVSLHRAEGFGRVMAEALYLGKPVVTSRYSGPLDFMSDDTAYLVDGELVDIKSDDYPFWKGNQWFQPEIQLAAEEMRKVRENRAQREAKAAAGRLSIRENYSLEACARFLSERFQTITGAGDQQ
ncbi:glycosyltransferase family 4 protein [Paraburkholderia phenoliruptrix]|uniref:glycosyltransferase family 4 protein n=1 Tax=Paraburkholderia phenoliruptrix TaxID=252970 RepID=UPI002869AC10|nr:glycosyltransferase family 4 protein [Paraburkholderia phenoliruptrix]WMY07498.1 glycosyltransferase family 4 protein [Paraburkholderia phenoliruptrix]